jgi:prophage tail gpP-like protein
VANEFIPRSQGKILPDAVTLSLQSGRVFEGWENMRIEKSIETIANAFSFSYDDRFAATNSDWPIRPGERVKINVGQERILTGYIDKMDISFSAGNRRISVAGRSLAGDIVDSSHSGPFEYKNIGLKEFAEELVQDYGLQVFLSVEPNILDKFSVKPAESVFQAIARAARLQGFFWVSTRNGNIRLTEAGRGRAKTELHQDINILSGSASFDEAQRFSNYKVVGQKFGQDTYAGINVSQPEGFAQDNGIDRFRPLIVIAEGSVDTEKATDRAQWEASSRAASGLSINVTVQGWRQQEGTLWDINQIVRLRSKFLGMDRDFLITSVSQSKDNSGGTKTSLSLVRKDSYLKKPIFDKEDDPKFGLGPNI